VAAVQAVATAGAVAVEVEFVAADDHLALRFRMPSMIAKQRAQ
jgi:hypothetical protein